MGKFKKLQEDIENVTNKEVVKQTRISGVATIRWHVPSVV